MEYAIIAKQIVDFQKINFDKVFNATAMFQDEAEKMTNTFMGKNIWMPEEGKKILDEWIGIYKQGRDNFKKVVDDSLDRALIILRKLLTTASIILKRSLPAQP